jgi:hypothetical protein
METLVERKNHHMLTVIFCPWLYLIEKWKTLCWVLLYSSSVEEVERIVNTGIQLWCKVNGSVMANYETNFNGGS